MENCKNRKERAKKDIGKMSEVQELRKDGGDLMDK